MTLDSRWSLAEESMESGDGIRGQEIQPPIGGSVATLSTVCVQYIEEKEDAEVSQGEAAREQNERTEMNNLLLD